MTALGSPSESGADVVNPTQWLAKVYTELLGRAPSTSEWQFWNSAYASSGCSLSTLESVGKAAAESSEFTTDYPEATDKASRSLALVRAVYNHEPSAGDWSLYYTPYANGTKTWNQIVDSIFDNGIFGALVVPQICSAADPNYGWGGGTAYTLPVSGSGPRTQAQLQTAINNAATAGGGTVLLDPNSVIQIGGSANNNQYLVIPAGVTVATAGLPGPTRYAHMARLVPAGRVCAVIFCGDVGIVRLQGGTGTAPGGVLKSVWVDGNNTGASNPSPTYNWQMANIETYSGNGIQVVNDRLSDPPTNGAAIRADGFGTRGVACSNQTITGNLITGYSGTHAMNQLGRGRWADGISLSCEQATVSGNTLVDITNQGISIHGNYNRAADTTASQNSVVSNNVILAAGSSAFNALNLDQVGTCMGTTDGGLPTSGDVPVLCLDKTAVRPFTNAVITNNTFWTSPRALFHIGIMVGSEPLFGDNSYSIFGTGGSVTNNHAGVPGTRVNVGISVGGFQSVALTGNSETSGPGGDFALVNATPTIPDNPCSQVAVGQVQNTFATINASQVQISGASYVGTHQPVTVVSNDTPGATASPSLYGCLVPDGVPGGLEPIVTATSGGNQIFQGSVSGLQFVPWGQNYVGGPTPLDPNDAVPMLEDALGASGNWSGLVADLREQKQMGSDVVRVHIDLSYVLDPPSTGFPNGTPNQTHLSELVRLANLAEQTGLYLDLTGTGEYRTIHTSSSGPNGCTLRTYAAGNVESQPQWYDCLTTTTDRWAVQSQFWSSVATSLANSKAIMVYDLQNEPNVSNVDQPAWVADVHPGGYFFNQYVNLVGTTDPGPMATQWINQQATAIRNAGDGHMITVGQFPQCPFQYTGFLPSSIANSSISYFSPHKYPTELSQGGSCAGATAAINDINTFGGYGKPVVIEETFDLSDQLGTQRTFMLGTQPTASGWMGQWGTPSLPELTYNPLGVLYQAWGALWMRMNVAINPLTGIAT